MYQRFSLLLAWLLLFVSGCGWSHDVSSRLEKAELFERFFSMPPPETISDLKGRRVRVGDSIADWLGVKCDDATFDQIVRRTSAVRLSASDAHARLAGDLLNPNRPDWWPNEVNSSVVDVYVLDRPYTVGRSQGDRLIFWRDAASQRLFAYYTAWT